MIRRDEGPPEPLRGCHDVGVRQGELPVRAFQASRRARESLVCGEHRHRGVPDGGVPQICDLPAERLAGLVVELRQAGVACVAFGRTGGGAVEDLLDPPVPGEVEHERARVEDEPTLYQAPPPSSPPGAP